MFWIFLVSLLFGTVLLASAVFAYKFYTVSKKVIEVQSPSSFFQGLKQITTGKKKTLKGEETGRINILILGIAGKDYPGENLTDTIMIVSINPKTYQTALLSIPRDLYTKIPDTKNYTKINALYIHGKEKYGSTASGVENLKKALAEITGLEINYYIAVDFEGFKKIIDEIGGISVLVPNDIHDERYPGPNFTYQTFDVKKGLQKMDGETALKYVRTRHDQNGDFGRAYRQQQILGAVRQKIFSLKTMLNIIFLNNILNALGEHIRTDVPLSDLDSFLDLIKKIDTHITTNEVLDSRGPDSLLVVSHTALGGVRAYILIPRTGNYSEIQERAKNIFNLDAIRRKKKAIKKEKATVAIINESGSRSLAGKIKRLLEGFDYETRVVSNKSADKNFTTYETIIYDMTGGKKPFSVEDISKKLQAKVSFDITTDLTSQCQEDFCLVLGKDLSEIWDYEENSLEDLERGYDKQKIDEKTYIELLKRGSSKKFVK